jgi:hypothetical protein
VTDLTAEQIEEWRTTFKRVFEPESDAELDALCDMAIAQARAGQEPVAMPTDPAPPQELPPRNPIRNVLGDGEPAADAGPPPVTWRDVEFDSREFSTGQDADAGLLGIGKLLVAVARAAYLALEDSEEAENGSSIIDPRSAKSLQDALDKLEELPAEPGYVSSGPNNAQYAIHARCEELQHDHTMLEDEARRDGPDGYDPIACIEALRGRAEAAEQQAAELREDAERYRYLRGQCGPEDGTPYIVFYDKASDIEPPVWNDIADMKVDAAIDAARSKDSDER